MEESGIALLLVSILVSAALFLSSPENSLTGQAAGKPAASNTAALNVKSVPSGASVYIDSRPKGTTPLELTDLAPGSHSVKVTKSGYRDFTTRVSLAAGKTRELTATLKPSASQPTPTPTPTTTSGETKLVVTSDPSKAQVSVDGAYKGMTPLTATDLTPETHKILVEKEGYSSYSVSFSLEKRKTKSLHAKLKPSGTKPAEAAKTGSLRITVRSEGKVLNTAKTEVFDSSGKLLFAGSTESGAAEFGNVPAGEHTVYVTAPGYDANKKAVKIEANRKTALTIELKPAGSKPAGVGGSMKIKVTYGGRAISNAQVEMVDPSGRVLLAYTGAAGFIEFLNVPAGEHTVYVTASGYSPAKKAFRIEAGRRTEGSIALEKEQSNYPTPTASTEPASKPAALKVTTIPSGAEVYVDGALKGKTPLAVDVTPGMHKLMITRYGYKDYSAILNLEGGRTKELHLQLRLSMAPFCGDGVCETDRENTKNCPEDCKGGDEPIRSGFCGNGVCDSGESYLKCPQDCKAPSEDKCVDSDEYGDNPFQGGAVKVYKGKTLVGTFMDKCNPDGSLTEFYCEGTRKADKTYYCGPNFECKTNACEPKPK